MIKNSNKETEKASEFDAKKGVHQGYYIYITDYLQYLWSGEMDFKTNNGRLA